MMTFREEIEQEIKNIINPNLNKSSVDAYVSTLLDFKNNLYPDGEDIKWFNKFKTIFEYSKDKEREDKRSILATLLILTENPEYKKRLFDDFFSLLPKIN